MELQNLSLSELAINLFQAKRVEEQAKKARIEVEEAVAAKVEGPETGSRTVEAGDGLKVTVTRGINYKADVDALRGLSLSDELIPLELIPLHFEFDEKRYEALRVDHPKEFALAAKHVTAKPKKVSVSLKL
jgi:hypothetical protein